jgi:hypothetical protein
MAKILNDKYYTSIELAKKCIDKTFEIIGEENITDIIEPSAGNGSFSDQMFFCTAYDIEPDSNNIIRQDFLNLNIPYQKGRLIIGNPPYGNKMQLAVKFFKKSIQLADYISFILPISQLDNITTLYEFDLIYSEDLGLQQYTDRNLNCVLNIYRRPNNGLNKKPNFKMKDLTIIRDAHKGYNEYQDYDLRMVYWGSGCAGKILSPQDKRYAGEYKITIHNEKIKDRIIEILSNTDWHKELKFIAMLRIKHYHIYNLLKREIPEIS